MMHQIKYLFLSIIFAFAMACSGEKVDRTTTAISDAFTRYTVDVKAKEQPLANQVASIELMLLEETDQSLISRIFLTQTYKDIYAFVANANREIIFYDRQGNFLNKFSRTGEGPEEYQNIVDFWITSDIIYLLDGHGNSLKKYSLSGEFIGSEKIPSTIAHIYPLGDQYLIQTNHRAYQDSLNYKWILTDQSFKPTGSYLPFEAPTIFDGSFAGNYIVPYKSGLAFYSMFTDSLHYLNDQKELSPLTHIDLEEQWFWRDKLLPNSEHLQELPTSDKAWDLQFYLTEHFIFGRSPLGYKGFISFIINRETASVTNLKIAKPNGELYALDIKTVENNRFLFSLPADEVALFLEEFGENQIQFREGTTLEKIERQENPVLVWVDFKTTE